MFSIQGVFRFVRFFETFFILPRFLKIRLIVSFGGRNKKVAKMCMYSNKSTEVGCKIGWFYNPSK